jgi:hypothetical protein
MVEYCRIGSDINPKWEDKLLKCLNAQERVSSLAAIDSAISRHQMNSRAFYNDPDVFILRKGNNYLTDSQKRSLYIINLVFGGLVFTSDNIGEYSETEMKLYLSHFPHKPKKINYVEKLDKIYKISFNINDREYMVISNLGEKAKALSLKKGEYIRFLSKDNMDILFVDKEKFITIAPYDTLCFYKMKGAAYELLGGSGHVFSGSEIKNFKVSEDNITLELSQRAILKEVVYIKVPMALENIKVNGLVLKTEEIKGLNIVKYDWDVNGVYFNKDVLRFKNYITEKPDELSVN